MNRTAGWLAVAGAALILEGSMCRASLIAGFDFQTTSSGGTAVVASPNTPTVFNANVGSGTLYMNGTNGSSSWLQASELSGFGGTAVNATNGLSSVTTSPSALALLGGTSNSANGKAVVFKFDMTGLQDLTLTYAAQRTSTGFTSHVWDTSTDAATWTAWGSFTSGTTAGTLTSSFSGSGILSLPAISALNNAANAYVRLTVTGSTNTSQNNRLDNVQISAVPVPEPSTVALTGCGLLAAATLAARRRATRDPVTA